MLKHLYTTLQCIIILESIKFISRKLYFNNHDEQLCISQKQKHIKIQLLSHDLCNDDCQLHFLYSVSRSSETSKEKNVRIRNKFQESRQTIPKDDTQGIPSNDYTPRYYNHVRNQSTQSTNTNRDLINQRTPSQTRRQVSSLTDKRFIASGF